MDQSNTNPFENESGVYRVLTNTEGQHSLWPDFAAIPAGWQTAFGPDVRAACLSHVDASWTDLRPLGAIQTSQAAQGQDRTS